MQYGGYSSYFSKEESFRLEFHCLPRSWVLPLSKNRSPELIFLPQGRAGLASCLDTQHRKAPPSKFTFPCLLSSLLSELGPPSQGLLPDEEVPSPAQRPKGSREHWGIVWPEPLGRLGAAEEEVLILSFWAGRAAALRLSVPPSAVPASPWEGRTSGAGGGSRQPELPRQALGSRRDDPDPDRPASGLPRIRRPPRRPPFLCSIASAFPSSTLQGGGPPPSPLCPEPAGLPECRAYSAALSSSLPPRNGSLEPSSATQPPLPPTGPSGCPSTSMAGGLLRGHLVLLRECSVPREAPGLKFHLSSHELCALKVLG